MFGETLATGAPKACRECKTKFVNEILSSAAGYYIGTACRKEGCSEAHMPNSRESGYYKTFKLADEALKTGEYGR